jgi:hypothetical protein
LDLGYIVFNRIQQKEAAKKKQIVLKLNFDIPIVETKPRDFLSFRAPKAFTLKQILDALDLAAADPRMLVFSVNI